MKRRDILGLGVATTASLALGMPTARAQARFPAKPLRLVVPYAAGGATDIVGRKYAERMSVLLGQQVVVENKAGAEAAIGAADIARSPADGYNILFGTSSTHIITPALMKNANYDPIKDFAQIAIFGSQALALVVNNDVPAKTLRELVAHMKANPGKYSYASPSSIARLTGTLFQRQAGVDMVEVPYKGGAQALQDFLSNRVQVYPAVPASVMSLYRSGKVRILAVCAPERLRFLPEVPTTGESGVPDLILASFNVVAVPAATPQSAVDLLVKHTASMVGDEGLAKELEAVGVEAFIEANPARANAFLNEYRTRLAPLLKSA